MRVLALTFLLLAPLTLLVFTLVALFGAGERDALTARGQQLFQIQGCHRCHTIGDFGTPIGPDLSRVGGRYSEAYLARSLRDPESQRPRSQMPPLELDPAQVEALAAWLVTLR